MFDGDLIAGPISFIDKFLILFYKE
jgi:hypothetical protein